MLAWENEISWVTLEDSQVDRSQLGYYLLIIDYRVQQGAAFPLLNESDK